MPCISVERANNLFDRDLGFANQQAPLFSITQMDWREYVSCTNFEWDPVLHHNEYVYWCTVGDKLFPSIAFTARHYVWVPPMVTKCDSWLSILAYMYSPRQSRLLPHVIAHRIFIRGNLDNLKPVKNHSASTNGTPEEDSFERDELDLLISSESDGDQTETYP